MLLYVFGWHRMAPWLLLVVACSGRPALEVGERCELHSECTSPFVCRLSRCRVECRGSRDCDPGLSCVFDDDGLGACQLPHESECTLNSDCPPPLVCRRGECTNMCERDEHCPAGTRCMADESGEFGCIDPSETACHRNSECPEPLICAVDGRCREQCIEDRDCRDGRVCVEVSGAPNVCDWRADGGPEDAGVSDGGMVDGGMVDGGMVDGGMVDGGTVDAGADAGPPPASTGLLTGGGDHSCAEPTPADLRCWGKRWDTGISFFDSPTPAATTLPGPSETLVSGAEHTCAVVAGELLCWGLNDSGQLGRSSPRTVTTPVSVGGIAPRTVASGRRHTCALDAAGDVSCWGANDRGQLGDGTTVSRATPAAVSLPEPATDITARGEHTCALLASGSIRCWGRNIDGRLGSGATTTSEPTPVAVSGIDDALEVEAGSTHTCARRATGEVWCWGSNDFGQLARPLASGGSNTPVAIAGLSDVVELEAGLDHVCARYGTGTIRCWGGNGFGQAGSPPPLEVLSPTAVSGISEAVEIAAGDNHTCARTASAEIRCWGANYAGQLGDGSGTSTHTPVGVAW